MDGCFCRSECAIWGLLYAELYSRGGFLSDYRLLSLSLALVIFGCSGVLPADCKDRFPSHRGGYGYKSDVSSDLIH